jgi:hypothetical protein
MSEFTIKEFAAQERVTERTVRNWIAKGAVCVRRTPGGGVRILVQRTTTRAVFVDMTNSENCGNPSR